MQPVREGKPFSHVEHVNRVWLGSATEVFRDCRGCHRFDAENEFSTPQAECDACHQGGGLEHRFLPGWQQDLSGYRSRTQPAFRHHTHGMLECRECHLPRDDFMEAHMPIRTGPGQCARCHEQTVTAADVAGMRWFVGASDPALAAAIGLAEPFTPPADAAAQQAYAARLATVFAGPDGGINTTPLPIDGDFDHADHIDTQARGVGLECAVCHTDIRTASALDVGTGQIPVDSCKECHIRDADRAAVRAAERRQQEERPLWSLGAFAHADHYAFLQPGAKRKDGVVNAQAYADIEQQACAACHQYAPAMPGFSARDFPFEADRSKHRYTDCIVCHDAVGWQTGETAAMPLHASTADSGAGGGERWGRCSECHVLGQPDLGQVRPVETVQRWTRRTFVFPANTHPDITTRGVQQSDGEGRPTVQDCTECHRAKVPELSSRLIEKVFRHDTHLPADATQANCVECHETATVAANSVTLAGADYRTYTLVSCTKCHWGGAVTEQLQPDERPTERAVVRFPHGPHVTKHGQSCVECHSLDPAGQSIVTKPEAAACNQCHDHVDGADDSEYEGLFDGRAESCVRCHHDEIAGQLVDSVPHVRGSEAADSDPRYRATQSVFAGFGDSQFHPLGGRCSDCHKAALDAEGNLQPLVRTLTVDHLLAVKNVSVHAPPPKGSGQSAPADCLRCHWKTVGSWDAAWRGAGPIADDPADARDLRRQPGSPATRERFGNLFEGYPGTDRAKG